MLGCRSCVALRFMPAGPSRPAIVRRVDDEPVIIGARLDRDGGPRMLHLAILVRERHPRVARDATLKKSVTGGHGVIPPTSREMISRSDSSAAFRTASLS